MQKRNIIFTLSVISMACAAGTSFAAKPIDLSTQSTTILRPLTAAAASQPAAIKETKRHVDFNRTTHIRIQQTYAGHPIWGAEGIVHIPNDAHASLASTNAKSTMNGTIYQDLDQDLRHTPASALNAAQADKALQHAIQLHKEKTGVSTYDNRLVEKNLIVYVDKNNQAHWAYFISFASANTNGTTAAPTYILDAVSFAVYAEWDNVQSLADVAGGGFGGNPKIGKIAYDGLAGNFPSLTMSRNAAKQICSLKNTDVEVKDDSKNGGIIMSMFAPIVQFKCVNINNPHKVYWDGMQDAINGAYSPANDALYIGVVIKKLYRDWYGLEALDGPLNFHIHGKDISGQEDMDNAFFFPMTKAMYFGDGVELFYPLTSLGVGAHEVSHGFTSAHSNLTYEKQSGGMNESFSDMAAQAAEFYSVGKNNWQIGPEIVKEGDKALRYMDDPTKDGKSIDNAKKYTDDLNVHYSSGVFNKAFYLLATTENWDTHKAFDVMVKANMDYWTANTNFATGACGVMSATKDYNYNTADVAAAMKGVGIDVSKCKA